MNLKLLSKYVLSTFTTSKHNSMSIDDHIKEAITWLCTAQDATEDGGVSLRYSFFKGWSASYPETTGYIIPTFFDYWKSRNKIEYFNRAIRMANWEISIQKPDGSFNGGPIGSGYGGFVFDTGQIIFGLLATYRETNNNKYLESAIKAGNWLKKVQDKDGKWSNFTFHHIPHVYYSRVAWALAKLGNITGDQTYTNAAVSNIRWALSKQKSNGWFHNAGFTENAYSAPYTHTIAYTIRGIFEVGILTNNEEFIDAAILSGKALLQSVRMNGSFYGTYDENWRSKAHYSCLTGNAQISIILLKIYSISRSEEYLDEAISINRHLCQCQNISGPPEIKGAISGSRPIWGRYQRFAFPNWATKFFIDALILEKKYNRVSEQSQ